MKTLRLPFVALFAGLTLSIPTAWGAPEKKGEEAPAAGAITWKVKKTAEGGGALMLSEKGSPPVKLCDVVNVENVKAFFSPGDKWLAVEDGGPSLGIHIALYKHEAGLHFTDAKIDLDDAIIKAAAATPEGKDAELLDHTFLHCLGWSPNGKVVRTEFSGHGAAKGQRIEVKGLKFAFFVETKKVARMK